MLIALLFFCFFFNLAEAAKIKEKYNIGKFNAERLNRVYKKLPFAKGSLNHRIYDGDHVRVFNLASGKHLYYHDKKNKNDYLSTSNKLDDGSVFRVVNGDGGGPIINNRGLSLIHEKTRRYALIYGSTLKLGPKNEDFKKTDKPYLSTLWDSDITKKLHMNVQSDTIFSRGCLRIYWSSRAGYYLKETTSPFGDYIDDFSLSISGGFGVSDYGQVWCFDVVHSPWRTDYAKLKFASPRSQRSYDHDEFRLIHPATQTYLYSNPKYINDKGDKMPSLMATKKPNKYCIWRSHGSGFRTESTITMDNKESSCVLWSTRKIPSLNQPLHYNQMSCNKLNGEWYLGVRWSVPISLATEINKWMLHHWQYDTKPQNGDFFLNSLANNNFKYPGRKGFYEVVYGWVSSYWNSWVLDIVKSPFLDNWRQVRFSSPIGTPIPNQGSVRFTNFATLFSLRDSNTPVKGYKDYRSATVNAGKRDASDNFKLNIKWGVVGEYPTSSNSFTLRNLKTRRYLTYSGLGNYYKTINHNTWVVTTKTAYGKSSEFFYTKNLKWVDDRFLVARFRMNLRVGDIVKLRVFSAQAYFLLSGTLPWPNATNQYETTLRKSAQFDLREWWIVDGGGKLSENNSSPSSWSWRPRPPLIPGNFPPDDTTGTSTPTNPDDNVEC